MLKLRIIFFQILFKVDVFVSPVHMSQATASTDRNSLPLSPSGSILSSP